MATDSLEYANEAGANCGKNQLIELPAFRLLSSRGSIPTQRYRTASSGVEGGTQGAGWDQREEAAPPRECGRRFFEVFDPFDPRNPHVLLKGFSTAHRNHPTSPRNLFIHKSETKNRKSERSTHQNPNSESKGFMNKSSITTLLARRADSGTPPQNGNRVFAPTSRSRRRGQRGRFGFVTALFAFVAALTGALSAGFVTPAFAETAPTYQLLKSFGERFTGVNTSTALIQDANGALYGTVAGGSYGRDTVFTLNPNGTGFTVLKKFDYLTTPEGFEVSFLPEGFNALIQGVDDALYGTTSAIGIVYCDDSIFPDGILFKLNTDGSGFTIVKSFDLPVRGAGRGGLFQGLDQAIYSQSDVSYLRYEVNGCDIERAIDGTVTGPNGFFNSPVGTVFKVRPDGSGFNVLLNLDYAATGGYPDGPLTQGTDRFLYGTARYGGSSFGSSQSYEGLGYGTVFKLDPNGNGSSVLLNFDSATTGAYPKGGLVEGADTALYGVTAGGVFKVNRDGTGFAVLKNFDSSTGGNPQAGLTLGSGGVLYGATGTGGPRGGGTVFRINPDGSFTVLLNFDNETTGTPQSRLVAGIDGNLYGTTSGGGEFRSGTVFRVVFNNPRISALTPPSVPSGSGGFTLSIDGDFFVPGSVVQWNGAALDTSYVDDSKLTAAAPNITTTDIYTALITVKNPDGTISSPTVFLVLAANVAEVESSVATAGQNVSVSTAPTGTNNTAGITATLANSGELSPVTVSTAIYNSNPSPSTAFEIDSATGVAGEFLDLQVTGADEADTMTAYFYYPTNAAESETSPTLKYYDGSEWVPVLSSGNAPEKNTTDNLEGTLSGGRFTVNFDDISTPKITELGGTFFAVTVPRPPLAFTGFLAPIEGADEATGGSFADPVQTFKAGSTIPVKFTASRNGTAIVTGVHTLQATKYSSETTAETPIDATPQGEATTGNRFELHGGEWHFNLDTKATGLTKGIWQFVATLSDGSQHRVWIQIK